MIAQPESKTPSLLLDILHALDNSEIQHISQQLKAKQKLSGEGSRTFRLWQLIIQKKYSENQIAKQLGWPSHRAPAYAKLCSRLRSHIYDLTFDLQCLKPAPLSYNTELGNRKKLYLATNLLIRGFPSAGMKLLNDVIKNCQKYELFEVLSKAYLIEMQHKYGSISFNTKKDLQEKFEWAESQRAFSIQIRFEYKKLVLLNYQRSNRFFIKSELQSILNKVITNPCFDTNSSARHLVNLIKIQLLLAESPYSEINKKCKSTIEFIKTRPAIHGPLAISEVYAALFVASINHSKFAKALEYIMRSKKILEPGSRNFLVLLEHELLCYYYTDNKAKFMKLSHKLQRTTDTQHLHHFTNRFQFYNCCYLFKALKFTEARKQLSLIREIQKDKAGWNLGIRYLAIMIAIETGEHIMADTEIENLRKFIQNNKPKTEFRLRDLEILKLFKRLSDTDYNFKSKDRDLDKIVKILSKNDLDYRHENISHELIPVHEWLLKKIKWAQLTKSARQHE